MEVSDWLELPRKKFPLPTTPRAAHPIGTPERTAMDLARSRRIAAILLARQVDAARFTRKLRAYLRVHPDSRLVRDWLRMYGLGAHRIEMVPRDADAWRAKRDALLSAESRALLP